VEISMRRNGDLRIKANDFHLIRDLRCGQGPESPGCRFAITSPA